MTKKEKIPTALVLRCCRADMSSNGGGFVWPGVGEVATASDWKDNKECGNGLHGWLYGQGDPFVSDYATNADAKWLVVEVAESDIRVLGGKCKFRSGTVRFVGQKSEAADYLIANEPRAASVAVIGRITTVDDEQTVIVGAFGTAIAGYRGTATAGAFGTAIAGYRGTATAGAFGTATAGHSGTATAGASGTAIAGYRGTATAGAFGTATAGASGMATAGAFGTATAGAFGTATAGHSGTATAGASGTAIAGYRGTATAGAFGTATAGASGMATAGARGEIRVRYWDSKNERYRTVIGYVGEGGIKANVAYHLDDNNKLVEVQP